MGFKQTVRRGWGRHQPVGVLLELTYVCNLDCDFCYNDRALRGQSLSLSQYHALLEELAALQVLNLTLSGGEPLVHPEFFAIGTRARDLGFVVRIKSNGHLLGRDLSQRLASEVSPYVVDVSLHGSTAAAHDQQTRKPGSFARLMRNLAHMREAGLRVKLVHPVTRWNEHQTAEVFELARSLDVGIQIDTTLKPRDDGDRTPLRLSASAEGVRNADRAAWNYSSQSPPRGASPARPRPEALDLHCAAGAGTACVDPVGNVLPCVQWRRPVGNLHEASFSNIWHGRALDEVREINRKAARMVGQLDQPMRFCPGEAHTRSGDALALYPAAFDTPDVRRRLPVLRSGGQEVP